MRLARLVRTRRSGRVGAAPADPATQALRDAERLVDDGRLAEAVDVLAASDPTGRDPVIETRVLELRHEAVVAMGASPGRSPWPPVDDDPFPDVSGCLPEVDASRLDARTLGGAVAHHGALVVRNMIGSDDARRVIDGMHRAEAARDRGADGTPAGDSSVWYSRFPSPDETGRRTMVERRGGIWLADSPANTALVLGLLRSSGTIDAVTGHLGERPCFSLEKSTLRRLAPVFTFTGWHQDGAFLGPEVRTMNVWIALSPCGGDRPTPGLELVPKRLHEVLSTEGGIGPISIAPALLQEVAADAPPVRPEFEPGDGLMFDERFLHRTYLHEHMTEPRYAIECWLFAPSHRSPDYLPVLV
jgi:hypothetical protein